MQYLLLKRKTIKLNNYNNTLLMTNKNSFLLEPIHLETIHENEWYYNY